jgi:hypothetical protein
VSNELSNYRGANLQPLLDSPGSIGAPAMEIDGHLACFTPKRSLIRTQYRPPSQRLVPVCQTTRSGPVSDQLSDYAPEPPCPKSRSMTVAPVWMTGRI